MLSNRGSQEVGDLHDASFSEPGKAQEAADSYDLECKMSRL
jgi:hypothetical protein